MMHRMLGLGARELLYGRAEIAVGAARPAGRRHPGAGTRRRGGTALGGERGAAGRAGRICPGGVGMTAVAHRSAARDRADPGRAAAAAARSGPTRDVPLPDVTDRPPASGLRVLAARRAGVPMVELRLRVPFAGDDPTHPAVAELLASTLLTGTATRDRVEIDDELAAVGADLGVGVDPERLAISGSGLAAGLEQMLGVLADVLTAASHPDAEVARERERLVERIIMARAQPRTIAREALQRRRFGDHPITREMPTAAEVEAVTAEQIRALQADALVPRSSILTIVGDIDPSGRDRRGRPRSWPAGPPTSRRASCRRRRRSPPATWSWCTAPARCSRSCGCPRAALPRARSRLRRAAAGQPGVRRLLLLALDGEHPRGQGLHLRRALRRRADPGRRGAGRRDRRGQRRHRTRAAGDPLRAGPAGARCRRPPRRSTPARSYAIGSLLISLDNQGGLASILSALAADGLDLDWLRGHPARLEAVTVDEVAAAALRFFAPSAFTGVLVGDAEVIGTRCGPSAGSSMSPSTGRHSATCPRRRRRVRGVPAARSAGALPQCHAPRRIDAYRHRAAGARLAPGPAGGRRREGRTPVEWHGDGPPEGGWDVMDGSGARLRTSPTTGDTPIEGAVLLGEADGIAYWAVRGEADAVAVPMDRASGSRRPGTSGTGSICGPPVRPSTRWAPACSSRPPPS